MKHKSINLLIILAFLATPSFSIAAGFRIGEQGAAAMGRANAVTAGIDDVSAVHFNPAALTTLKKSWVSIGSTVIVPSTDYINPLGNSSSKENQFFYPPNFYVGKFFKEKQLALGFGVNIPFGLGSKWSNTGPFRYEATYTDLKVINFNPSVAYRFNSIISVGAGLNYEKLFVTFDKQNPWQVFGGEMDGKTHLSGEGTGLGYNLGILFSPTGKIKIGIAYRSRVHFDVRGEVELTRISGTTPLLVFGSSRFRSDVSLPIDLPDTLSAGVAYQISDGLTIEFDLDWTGWSSYKELKFNYTDERPPFLEDTAIQKSWKDVTAYRIGLEYHFNKNIKGRGGYAFDPGPIPGKTFEPRSPGSDRHQLAVGSGLVLGKFVFDIAYMAVFLKNRVIENDIGEPITNIDGEYKSFCHLVGTNVSYKF